MDCHIFHFNKNISMKLLKIYSIISTIVILVLSVSLYNLTKNYNKTQKEFDNKKKKFKETE